MAFAPTKGKKYGRAREGGMEIKLTSMMDMFTIILLFLIKSYSVSGGLVQPTKYFELPLSARDKDPKKVTSILVANNGESGVKGVLEDVEGEVRYLTTAAELNDPNVVVLDGLKNYLDERKKQDEAVGKRFLGEITIQCDKTVPYKWLLKVINTCGQSEYGYLEFVVKRQT